MTIEIAGNIVPVTKSGDQLQICFHAFHESRLPFSVRVRDVTQPALARLSFMSETRTFRSDITGTGGNRSAVCSLTISMPDDLHADSNTDLQSPRATSSAHCLHDNCTRMNIVFFLMEKIKLIFLACSCFFSRLKNIVL